MEVVDEGFGYRLDVKRRDVLVEQNPALAQAIERKIDALHAQRGSQPSVLDNFRGPVRKALLSSDRSDPHAYERVIGASDLLSINFLSRGLETARAICRIRVPSLGGEWHGSGFLVGPRLLVTNHHVLGTAAEAAQAQAEFGYEHDAEGVLAPPIGFNLAPHECFFTDSAHDVTLVAVVPLSDGGIPLERYGYLPLLPLSGKGVHGEWVTLIQHPGGGPKQMAIRSCQIVELEESVRHDIDVERFIHYTTDTEPGSSGAPVLNDQWQVVAVHHKAVPDPGQDLEGRLERGEEPIWLANEGIRISAISSLLERKRLVDCDAAEALARIERGLGIQPIQPLAAPSLGHPELLEKDAAPYKAQQWSAWTNEHALGYDPTFVQTVKLPIDALLGKQKAAAAPLAGGEGHVLDYLHFSTVVHAERRFPLLTAVNIDGMRVQHPGERKGSFRLDRRMEAKYQSGGEFYEAKAGKDRVQFSRGHLVRRFDPCWGTKAIATLADSHTFHYTNAAPQVQGFNGGRWLDVEDYVLDRVQTKQKRMSVFSGPIFRDNDPEYGHDREGGPWKVPITYWKVVVIEKAPGQLAATAFMLGQIKFVEALYETRVFTNLRQTTLAELQSNQLQTSIKAVEDETGLDFSALRPHDALNALESTRKTRLLRSPRDIAF